MLFSTMPLSNLAIRDMHLSQSHSFAISSDVFCLVCSIDNPAMEFLVLLLALLLSGFFSKSNPSRCSLMRAYPARIPPLLPSWLEPINEILNLPKNDSIFISVKGPFKFILKTRCRGLIIFILNSNTYKKDRNPSKSRVHSPT